MSPHYLLDTDICIYIRQNRPTNVRRRFEQLRPGEAAISTVTYGELLYGAARSRERGHDTALIEAFARALPVLPLPPTAGDAYGPMRANLTATGTVIGSNDLWIAAHALAADLTLVTNNEREFRRIDGLRVENWAAG